MTLRLLEAERSPGRTMSNRRRGSRELAHSSSPKASRGLVSSRTAIRIFMRPICTTYRAFCHGSSTTRSALPPTSSCCAFALGELSPSARRSRAGMAAASPSAARAAAAAIRTAECHRPEPAREGLVLGRQRLPEGRGPRSREHESRLRRRCPAPPRPRLAPGRIALDRGAWRRARARPRRLQRRRAPRSAGLRSTPKCPFDVPCRRRHIGAFDPRDPGPEVDLRRGVEYRRAGARLLRRLFSSFSISTSSPSWYPR